MQTDLAGRLDLASQQGADAVKQAPSHPHGDDSEDRDNTNVPCVSLDATSLPAREQFEAWRVFGEGLCDMFPLNDRPSSKPGKAVAWRVDNVVASRMAFPAYRFRRFDAKKSCREDLLVLRLFHRGTMRGLLGGAPVEMSPGVFHLFDYERSFEGVCEADGARTVVALPHRMVGYDPKRDAAHIHVSANSPGGRLLESCVKSLFEEAPRASADDAARLSIAFIAVLKALFLSSSTDDATRASVERTRAATLHRYVDEHFLDPMISAAKVGRAVGASRATVYRVFAHEGGFDRAVRDRRLRAALTELSKTAAKRGVVAEVARRWGFDDAGWFTRLCRERFGCAPTDVLGVCAWSDQSAQPVRAAHRPKPSVPLLRSLYQ